MTPRPWPGHTLSSGWRPSVLTPAPHVLLDMIGMYSSLILLESIYRTLQTKSKSEFCSSGWITTYRPFSILDLATSPSTCIHGTLPQTIKSHGFTYQIINLFIIFSLILQINHMMVPSFFKSPSYTSLSEYTTFSVFFGSRLHVLTKAYFQHDTRCSPTCSRTLSLSLHKLIFSNLFNPMFLYK